MTYVSQVFVEGSRALKSCNRKTLRKRVIEESQSDEASEMGRFRNKRR